MSDPISDQALALILIACLAILLSVPVFAWFAPPLTDAERFAALTACQLIKDAGGFILDGDPLCERYEDEIADACAAGWLSSGGGWGYGFTLTKKGKNALSERSAKGRG